MRLRDRWFTMVYRDVSPLPTGSTGSTGLVNSLPPNPETPCRESRAVFDTREHILNQLRAGEDGRAEFKEVRLGDLGLISPNTEGPTVANHAGRALTPAH